MGGTIKIRDVPDDTRKNLERFKQEEGLTWKGVVRQMEKIIHLTNDAGTDLSTAVRILERNLDEDVRRFRVSGEQRIDRYVNE